MAVAPAAPGIGIAGYFIIGLLALLAWAVMRGLLAAWIYTFGAMLQRLASILTFRKFGLTVDLGGPIRALDTTIRNVILKGATKAEHLAGYFFHGCAVMARWTAGEIEGLAGDTLAWAQWLQHAHLPKLIKGLAHATIPLALIHRIVNAAVAANVPHVARTTTTRVEHVVTHTVTRIVRASSGAVALPGWAIALPGRVGGLERDLSGLRKRIGQLEKVGAVAVTVGLAAAILRKLKLNCLLGKNGKTLGKQLCRVDPDFFASLFLDGLLITSAISIRQFAKECIATVDFFEEHFAHFVSELKNPLEDYLGPIKGAPKSVDDLLKLSFTDYLG